MSDIELRKAKKQTVRIEHGIPIPDCVTRGRIAAIIGAMKIGDSFEVESGDRAHGILKRYKGKVTTRKIDGEGYRVWKIA